MLQKLYCSITSTFHWVGFLFKNWQQKLQLQSSGIHFHEQVTQYHLHRASYTHHGMVNEYQLSELSNNNDGDDGCSVHAAYRRTYGPGQLAWSKGRRTPGAVATFIA